MDPTQAPSGPTDLPAEALDPGLADERRRDLLELACSTARLGIFERDLRTGVGVWNRALFEMRGLEGDCQAPPFEEAAAGVIEADRAHFDAAMRGSLMPRRDPVRQQHFRMRYRVHAQDGNVRYLHKQWIVRYGDDGRAEQMRGVVVDDTPYQLLLRSRSEAAAQLSLAADLTGMAVWQQDVETGLVQLNAQAAALFDVEQHSVPIPLARMRMSLHPDDRAAADAADAGALASGRPVDAELRHRSRSGGWHRLLTRRGVQADAEGCAVMLVGVALDSPTRDNQAVPQDGAAPGLSNHEERYRFLTRVSHELRTPMNAVLGFAQLLSYHDSSERNVPPARRQALAHITVAGQHLMALINDVLDLSRLEGGEMPLTLGPVRLEEAAGAALSMLDLPRRERRMVLQTSGLGLYVLADDVRLRQVLINLVGNAIKYGREGGLVSIEAERQPDGVHLRIADDGPGIAADQLHHLFEPFNRLGAAHTAVEGTGLGLSISKALIERMGGSVSVRSRLGAGSTFELVLLPASADPADAPASDMVDNVMHHEP